MAESGRESSLPTDGHFVRRVLIVAVVVIVVVALALTFIYAVDILLLLFAGTLLARFLGGLSRGLSKRTRLSYTTALFIVSFSLFTLFAGTVAYLAPQISDQLAILTDELTAASQDLYGQLEKSKFVNKLLRSVQEPDAWLPSNFNAMAAIGGIFSTAAGAVTGLAIIVFVGVYMAADPSLYTNGLLSLIPPQRRERAREVFNAVGDAIWWWIMGRLASMMIIGVVITIGLWLLGIPVPLALGILAALLTFIPNFGPLVALIPPTVLALRDGPMWALAIVIFYVVVQIVESYVITPLIQQRSVALPPVITISTQILLGFFTGIVGLAVATPLAAVGMVLVQELYVKDVLGGDDMAPLD